MFTRIAPLAALALIPLALGACTTVSEAVHGPQLSAIAYPAQLMPMTQEVLAARDPARPASPNSLWRTGSRAFFHDQRASKIGDIVTVSIDIKDNATLSNDTATSRTTSTDGGISHLFGLESSIGKILPGSPDPAHLVTTGSDTSMKGAGSVNRSEAVSLTIAGIVRPEDITAANTIKHTQIAEARVSYGGRGAVSRVQKVPAGQALAEAFTPF